MSEHLTYKQCLGVPIQFLLVTLYKDNQNDLYPTKSKSTVVTNRLKRFSL